MLEHLEIVEGIGRFRPRGESSLVEAVDLIRRAIGHCRDLHIARLLVDARNLVGVSVPSLVDRFLMAEEWAKEAQSMVAVALVVRAEYIHPEKFGMQVAAHFGLKSDVYSSETDALRWLENVEASS